MASENLSDCDAEKDFILSNLNDQVNIQNIVHLNQFSLDQWKDVLSLGGADFYAANGALRLPISWHDCSEKIPLQAKVYDSICLTSCEI